MTTPFNKISKAKMARGKISQPKTVLAIIALLFDLVPIVIVYLLIGSPYIGSITIMLIILSPIIGLVLGVAALSSGNTKIGTTGKVIAIMAVALPLLFMGFILLFFIGAVTGLISFM